jgi:hypothetical protein
LNISGSSIPVVATCLALLITITGCSPEEAATPTGSLVEATDPGAATPAGTMSPPSDPGPAATSGFATNVVADATPFQPEAARIEGDALVSTGAPGFVVYGPYATLSEGRYVLLVEGRVEDAGDGQVIVDVVSRGRVFAEQAITSPVAEGTIATLAFELDGSTPDVEFRVRVGEGARIRVTGYRVTGPG